MKLKPIEVIEAKRRHLLRLANQKGAAGEMSAIDEMANWTPRPRGAGLKVLLTALREKGIVIKASSFDAIALPDSATVDFSDSVAVQTALPYMTFIEIKTANQKRVTANFSGFFFALTESEISASEALGDRHKVALYNKVTGEIKLTSVAEIIAAAKSTNWQLSVQL
jgi:hypothetical protein